MLEDPKGFQISIKSLRAAENGARILVTVCIENGSESETRSLPLTTEQYHTLNLKKGRIDEELFDELERASRFCQAVRCGENLLSYGANSVKLLSAKLMRHGYSREESVAAAEHLQGIGLINERADMQREVEKCLRKLWGAGRIRAHLWERGFGKDVTDALEELLCEVDFTENCAAMIRKHYGGLPESGEELRRITAAMYRYGYRSEEIRGAWRLLKTEA